jgi:hypothetical protein
MPAPDQRAGYSADRFPITAADAGWDAALATE